MFESNFEKKSKKEIDSLWEEMLKKAVLNGCKDGFKKSANQTEIRVYKESPIDFGEIPFYLLGQFRIGYISVFMKERRSAKPIVEDFIFWDKKNKWLKISDFAPEGTLFVDNDRFTFSQSIRIGEHIIPPRIGYNEKDLMSQSGSFLSFFHELGHLRNRGGISDKLYGKITEIGRDAHDKSIMLEEMIDKYSIEERALLLQWERDAWAWAIKTLRLLRSEGFDLIPGFGEKEIMEWTHNTRLESYCYRLFLVDDPGYLRDVRTAHIKKIANEK